MASNIGTGPQDIPINAYLGQQAFLDQPAERPALLAHHTNNQNNPGGSNNPHDTTLETTIFTDVRFDNYGAYNSSNGEYTVPQRGLYCMTVSSNMGSTNMGNNVQCYLKINGTSYQRAYLQKDIQDGTWFYRTLQWFVPAEKGDVLTLQCQADAGTFWFDDDGLYTAFAIHMVT